MARLFCGPDKTPWISVDFRSPEAAVRTFLEALRRDEPEIVYQAMSGDLRKDLGVDSTTLELIWPKIRERVPGLHVAGYAEVPEPTRHGPSTASVTLEVGGHVLEIRLFRETIWEVRYTRPGDTPGSFGPAAAKGGRLDSLLGAATVEVLDDRDASRITLAPFTFGHYVERIPLEMIEAVVLERRWKVAALRGVEP